MAQRRSHGRRRWGPLSEEHLPPARHEAWRLGLTRSGRQHHEESDSELSDHRPPSMAASIRRVADAACSFATLVYPIISPLWPEALSEQRDRGAGPIPFRPKRSTISVSLTPPRSQATKCIPPSCRRISIYCRIVDSIAAASALRRSV